MTLLSRYSIFLNSSEWGCPLCAYGVMQINFIHLPKYTSVDHNFIPSFLLLVQHTALPVPNAIHSIAHYRCRRKISITYGRADAFGASMLLGAGVGDLLIHWYDVELINVM